MGWVRVKVEFGTSSAFREWVRVRVLGYGFGVRGRKVKSRDCALASDLVRAHFSPSCQIITYNVPEGIIFGQASKLSHIGLSFLISWDCESQLPEDKEVSE